MFVRTYNSKNMSIFGYVFCNREIRFVRKRSLYNFSKALKAEKLDSLNAIIGNTIRSATYKHFALRVYNEKPHLIKNIKAVRNYFQNLKP